MMKDVLSIRASIVSVFTRGTAALATLMVAVLLSCAPSLAYAENDSIAPISDGDIAQAVLDESNVEDATVEQVAIVDTSAQDDSPTDQAATDDSIIVDTDSNTPDSTSGNDGDESTSTPTENTADTGIDPADPEPAVYEETENGAETYPNEDGGTKASDAFGEQAASVEPDLTESVDEADTSEAFEPTELDLSAKAGLAEANGAKATPDGDAEPVTSSPISSEETAADEGENEAETPKKAAFDKREAKTKAADGSDNLIEKESVASTANETYTVFYENTSAIQADDGLCGESNGDSDHRPIDPTPTAPATPAEPVAPAPSTSSTICCGNGSPSGAHAAAFIETIAQPGGTRASSAPEFATARTFGPHKGPARCRSPSLC